MPMALLVPDVSLLRFSQLKIKSNVKQNETSFIGDRCCHLTLCSPLIEPNLTVRKFVGSPNVGMDLRTLGNRKQRPSCFRNSFGEIPMEDVEQFSRMTLSRNEFYRNTLYQRLASIVVVDCFNGFLNRKHTVG